MAGGSRCGTRMFRMPRARLRTPDIGIQTLRPINAAGPRRHQPGVVLDYQIKKNEQRERHTIVRR